ncbi:MAG: hypothetical protein MSS97_05685 [Arcanobacterium sp.]|nr:hypothetical protein [Arcanobacterium sp.]MDY6143440.1 hypothetical protein [Arcanobacterium sp.]
MLANAIDIMLNPVGWGAGQYPVLTVGGIAIVLFVVMLTWIPITNRCAIEAPSEE